MFDVSFASVSIKLKAILSEATLRYYMKHCNFRFDENKGEWIPKTDENPIAEKPNKNDRMAEETDQIPETVEEDGSFQIEL